ncbi:Transposase for insertion sequence element IS905 [Frankliniella fusca]|uniref:Transposase for insertion sequence element IS905 n=1 Tax=Frankliniella fusca TaxID=407009 RepID=A0AAE1HE64_9NEOP|nr:Transposase for insertion sequence element IS905 [Frankliniella fusca]
MAIAFILIDYPELRPEMKFLLMQQQPEPVVDVSVIMTLRLLLDVHGYEFVNSQANAVLDSEDGKSEWEFLVKEYQRGINLTCLDSPRSCPCKHDCRQNSDALVDLSRLLLETLVNRIEQDVSAMNEIIVLPWEIEMASLPDNNSTTCWHCWACAFIRRQGRQPGSACGRPPSGPGGMSDNIELVRSNKGKLTLCHGGFTYTEHSRNLRLLKIYWRCTERSVCNARIHTNLDEADLRVLREAKHIGHLPDHRAIEAKKVVQGIKRHAAEHPNEPPQQRNAQVMRRAIGNVEDPEVLARLLERQTIRRVVHLHQSRGRPRIPAGLADIVLEAPYTTTKRGTRFLLFDSDDVDRIVVFVTDEALRILCASEIIFADGTFKTVPTEDTYRKIWQVLTDEAERQRLRFRVKLIMTDFEIAAMNVSQHFFPAAERKGCLFHFNQSLWRKAVDEGLRVPYINAENEEHTVRRDIQRLMAIPFVPVNEVEEVFDMVYDDVDDRVLNLATHLDNNYIRGHRALRRRRAVPPMFPVALWNVHEQAVENTHRTNNVVEAYHSKFQKLLVVHHANVWKFLDEIRSEEHDFHQILAQIRAGHINVKQPVNKKYEMCQRRLHRLAETYEEYKERGEIFTYLEAVAYNLKIQPE